MADSGSHRPPRGSGAFTVHLAEDLDRPSVLGDPFAEVANPTAAFQEDRANRVQDARLDIEFALRQEKIVDVILNALEKKKIPERITHNDTKFNNVMLDVVTGQAMCVVDLDTVMPGSALYDFGDGRLLVVRGDNDR